MNLLQVDASRTLMVEAAQEKNLENGREEEKEGEEGQYIPLAQVDVSCLEQSLSSPSSLC